MVVLLAFSDIGLSSTHHSPATGAVSHLQIGGSIDNTAGWKIRTGDKFHQLINANLWIVDQRQSSRTHFLHIVRRNVGSHTHSNTQHAVHEQVRELSRQNMRLVVLTIVVLSKVNRVLFDIDQKLFCDAGKFSLGITHSSRCVAVHGTKVTLAVYKRVAIRKVLRHAHHGLVNCAVTVRVILSHHFSDHVGRLTEAGVGSEANRPHGVQNAAVDRLHAVTYVRQGTRNNHRHGVIQIRPAHLFSNALFFNDANGEKIGRDWIVGFICHK